MCAVFGFLDYGKKVSHKLLVKLLNELAKAAEIRGTDATGISYVKDGEMVTFKKAKPAHKVNLYFPKETTAVIGHTRMTTQGSESKNYNNHPFEGKTTESCFALAHNGVLYNDKELRVRRNILKTEIETDSYIAVQLLEKNENVDTASIKDMAEAVEGSFVFTILRNDNTLFLVKGSNPLTIYHFPELGMYVYASTKSILDKALKKSALPFEFCEIDVSEGDILEISPDGSISRSAFEVWGFSPFQAVSQYVMDHILQHTDEKSYGQQVLFPHRESAYFCHALTYDNHTAVLMQYAVLGLI